MKKDFINYKLIHGVNKVAHKVIMYKGVHYKSNSKTTAGYSETPLNTRPIPKDLLKQRDFVDMTGIRFGNFRVIGLAEKNSKKITWVCKCLCGAYEFRTKRAIQNPANSKDRCSKCRDFIAKKRDAVYLSNLKRGIPHKEKEFWDYAS
jgi:hypothetical protein